MKSRLIGKDPDARKERLRAGEEWAAEEKMVGRHH